MLGVNKAILLGHLGSDAKTICFRKGVRICTFSVATDELVAGEGEHVTVWHRVALGRKNFLHTASELGAHGTAIGYSLVNTCLLHDIDPFIYLCDVLERVGACSQHDVGTLLPQNWKGLYLEEATARYQSPPAPGGGPASSTTEIVVS